MSPVISHMNEKSATGEVRMNGSRLNEESVVKSHNISIADIPYFIDLLEILFF